MPKKPLLGFESKDEPLLSKVGFLKRMARNLGAATILVSVSLVIGMIGYRYFEGMAWIDAFVNAAMILSGMGPISELHTWGGKFFAGCYALYSGLILVVTAGVIAVPVLHRILHRFHVEDRTK